MTYRSDRLQALIKTMDWRWKKMYIVILNTVHYGTIYAK
jgi:hypothetical protein